MESFFFCSSFLHVSDELRFGDVKIIAAKSIQHEEELYFLSNIYEGSRIIEIYVQQCKHLIAELDERYKWLEEMLFGCFLGEWAGVV